MSTGYLKKAKYDVAQVGVYLLKTVHDQIASVSCKGESVFQTGSALGC